MAAHIEQKVAQIEQARKAKGKPRETQQQKRRRIAAAHRESVRRRQAAVEDALDEGVPVYRIGDVLWQRSVVNEQRGGTRWPYITIRRDVDAIKKRWALSAERVNEWRERDLAKLQRLDVIADAIPDGKDRVESSLKIQDRRSKLLAYDKTPPPPPGSHDDDAANLLTLKVRLDSLDKERLRQLDDIMAAQHGELAIGASNSDSDDSDD